MRGRPSTPRSCASVTAGTAQFDAQAIRVCERRNRDNKNRMFGDMSQIRITIRFAVLILRMIGNSHGWETVFPAEVIEAWHAQWPDRYVGASHVWRACGVLRLFSMALEKVPCPLTIRCSFKKICPTRTSFGRRFNRRFRLRAMLLRLLCTMPIYVTCAELALGSVTNYLG